MRVASLFFVIVVACPLATVLCITVPASATEVLHFEDVFGPCGDSELVVGPGTVMIENVTFVSPEPASYGVGKEYSNPAEVGNPFESDSYHFHTYGAGATIQFPTPILSMRFTAGVHMNQLVWPTFELIAGGEVVATFGANISTLVSVDVSLPAAPTEVVIRYVNGSSSCLGIDDLEYEPGPYTETERAAWGRIKAFWRE